MTDDISALLDSRRGTALRIRLRSGKTVTGILRDFDIHMTMKLDSAVEEEPAAEGLPGDAQREIGSVLLRGDNILMISIPDEDGGGTDGA